MSWLTAKNEFTTLKERYSIAVSNRVVARFMSSFSKKRVLEILDQAQEGDNFSKFIDRFLGGLIVLNILAVSLNQLNILV